MTEKNIVIDKTKKYRKLNLDILRIIACFFVIINHTDNTMLLSLEPSARWFVSATMLYICKVAVPLFIMISGAVLLGKEESYKDLYKKRVLRTAVVIVVFSFVYYINMVIKKETTFSLKEFWQAILHVPITNAYWYLYMYLGLMIMLPMLRKLVKNMETKDYIYCLVIWTIFMGVFPIINHYLEYKPITYCFNIPIISVYVIYFIMGYLIENKLDKKYFNKAILIVCIILSIICIGISVWLTYYDVVRDAENKVFMDNTEYITIAIPSLTVFYIAKYIAFKNKDVQEGRVVANIATHTFGIYLLSDLLIQRLDFISEFLGKYVDEIIAMVGLEISVFIVGYMITWILKKIPLVKKLL